MDSLPGIKVKRFELNRDLSLILKSLSDDKANGYLALTSFSDSGFEEALFFLNNGALTGLRYSLLSRGKDLAGDKAVPFAINSAFAGNCIADLFSLSQSELSSFLNSNNYLLVSKEGKKNFESQLKKTDSYSKEFLNCFSEKDISRFEILKRLGIQDIDS